MEWGTHCSLWCRDKSSTQTWRSSCQSSGHNISGSSAHISWVWPPPSSGYGRFSSPSWWGRRPCCGPAGQTSSRPPPSWRYRGRCHWWAWRWRGCCAGWRSGLSCCCWMPSCPPGCRCPPCSSCYFSCPGSDVCLSSTSPSRPPADREAGRVSRRTLGLAGPGSQHTSSSPYLQRSQSWDNVGGRERGGGLSVLTFMTLNLSVVPVISTTGNKNWNARFVTRLQSCPLLLKTTRAVCNGHFRASCKL